MNGLESLADKVKTTIRKAKFKRHSPWMTKFMIDGKFYGGWWDAMKDERIVTQFRRAFPDARKVLELGSFEGGHTFALAKQPGILHVMGLEGRAANLKRAEFAKQMMGIRNVQFVRVNFEEPGVLEKFHGFDAVCCSGVLYHLPRPWELLKQLEKISSRLFLCTHYCTADNATVEQGSYKGVWYEEGGLTDPLSGLSRKSFWPTLASLSAMLEDAGFADIEIINANETAQNGPRVQLVAKKRV